MKHSFATVVVSAGLIAICGCSAPASKLPVYEHVPEFTMTDPRDRPFSAGQMNGSVWVVDFIYTQCPAECPRMSSQMHRLASGFQDQPGVRFLSISVDPARDTPAALAVFAKRWGAPNRQWQFITGSPESVHLLAYTTFHVGDVIDKIEHSTRFALVDKSRNIRGYYSSFEPESLAQLKRDIESLQRSKQ